MVVQLTAQLVGTGLGLLVRHCVLAFGLTIVAPLGLWLLLGAVSPAAQEWLTPFASAQHQLSGAMTGLSWAQTATVLLLWGVGLNLVGLRRLRRR